METDDSEEDEGSAEILDQNDSIERDDSDDSGDEEENVEEPERAIADLKAGLPRK